MFRKKVKDDLLDEEVSKNPKSKKKLIVVAGVVLVIALLVVIKLATSKTETLTYVDTFNQVFTNELGYFKYTFDIQTGEKGSLSAEEVTNTVISEDAVSLASIDVDTDESQPKNEFKDWGTYAEVKTTDWRYPNYKLTIEGNTTSLDPLTTDIKIYLATSSYNNLLTEICCVDGVYYLDIESMYNWLKDSADSYLMSLSTQLPNGSKWLVIPENDLKVISRYTEDGEQDFSACNSLKTVYERFLVYLLTFTDSISPYINGEVNNDTVSFSLTGDSADNFVSGIKEIAVRSGDFYSGVLESSKDLYTEDQYKQAVREKDNFIESFHDLSSYLQTVSIPDLNTGVIGSARQYTNGNGNSQLEASLAIKYSSDKDVIVKFSGVRSGDNNEVVAPEGSQNKTNDGSYAKVFSSVCDYLNFTKIKPSVKLDITPDTIADNVLNDFASLVNTAGTNDTYLTRNNVMEYIQRYSKPSEDASNTKLVSDLTTALNKITSGVDTSKPVEEEVPQEADVEKYPKVVFEDKGVVFEASYDEGSNARILKLKVAATNKTGKPYTLDVTKISLRNLLNSKFPANNEVLLRGIDTTFDTSKLVKTVKVKPNEWREFYLYFTPDTTDQHLDFYYDETNCGSAIEY